MGAATLAVGIAFANLLILTLVRALDRSRELAVRMAVGAGPGEPRRQLVLEAVIVALLGGAGASLLALWSTPWISRLALDFGGLARRDITIGLPTVLALGVSAIAGGALCGLLARPAATLTSLRGGRSDPVGHLAARRALVAAEAGVTLVLVALLAVVGTSLDRVLAIDPGFEPEGLVKAQLSLPPADYPDAASVTGFYAALRTGLASRLSGASVAIVDEAPMTGDGGRRAVALVGGDRGVDAVVRAATAGYFETLGVGVAEGRGYAPSEAEAVRIPVLASTELVRALGFEGAALGRALRIDGVDAEVEIVGVVEDVRHRALDEPLLPSLYLPAERFPSASSVLMVRSDHPPAIVIAAARDEVAILDPGLPLYGVATMADVVARSPGVPALRLLTVILAAFGLLAMALSALGLFGTVAHDVRRRAREIDLRVALGARPGSVVWGTLVRNGRPVLIGLAGGAAVCVALTGTISTLTVQVTAVEAGVLLVLASASVLVVTLGAALPAARAAARREPMAGLRRD